MHWMLQAYTLQKQLFLLTGTANVYSKQHGQYKVSSWILVTTQEGFHATDVFEFYRKFECMTA